MGLTSEYRAEKTQLLRTAGVAIESQQVLDLPPSVRRRFESLSGERPRAAVVEQKGALRTAPDQPWMPFTSQQVYAMEPPGFVWLAHARVAPLLMMTAKDRWIGGAGNMHIRLFDFITVANARGPEIDQGAALRYWGEILAFPETTLSAHLRWERIDDRRSRFTVLKSDPRATAIVEFDAAGLPVATRAERYRSVGRTSVLTPWTGRMRNWRTIDGRTFPGTWESVWHLDEGEFLAVKMEVVSVRTWGEFDS